MKIVIGPVLSRADGYAYDTWAAGKRVTRSYRYRWIDQAYYARNPEIKTPAQGHAPAAIVCQTLDDLIANSTEYEMLAGTMWEPLRGGGVSPLPVCKTGKVSLSLQALHHPLSAVRASKSSADAR
jgi:hypothetical protein